MPRNPNPASRYSLSNANGEGDLTFDITPQTTMDDLREALAEAGVEVTAQVFVNGGLVGSDAELPNRSVAAEVDDDEDDEYQDAQNYVIHSIGTTALLAYEAIIGEEVSTMDEARRAVDAYMGHWPDPADYGRDMFDNTGEQLPVHLRGYFDYESYGRDCLSDYSEYADHYFSL